MKKKSLRRRAKTKYGVWRAKARVAAKKAARAQRKNRRNRKYCIVRTYEGDSLVFGKFNNEKKAVDWLKSKKKKFQDGENNGFDKDCNYQIVRFFAT